MEIISREEARERGLKHYFSGKPCKRGHTTGRRVSSNDCVECSKIRQRSPDARNRKREHYLKNREAAIERASKRYAENREELISASCRRQKENLAKIYKKRSERMKVDSLYACKERVRCLLKESIKTMGFTKRSRTSEILGCSSSEFKQFIERQFTKGMSWENMGEWHLDHIVPISSAKSEKEVIELNHHTNLRPIWAEENLRKSNKHEFLI